MADGIAASFESQSLAASGIAQAIRRYDTSALDEAIVSTNILAEMAGDLMVREGDRGGPKMIALADGDAGSGDRKHFVSLPWEEAVEEFRKRGNVTPTDLQRLIQDVSVRSAQERNKLLAFVQQTTLDKLATAVEEGETYEDFAEALRTETVPLGITADDDSYLQMVFRTNVQGAYSAGRDRASKDPEILEQRPFALYLTAGDGFVRSEHAEYAERNNGVYRIGSPEWEAVRPPPKDSPFNCRCSWVTLTREQALERGAQV
jgi:hypothetical protein